MTRVRVAVLAGGLSPERDVSFATARAILAHLPPDRFEGIRVEVCRDGRWAVGEEEAAPPEAAAARLRALGVGAVFPGLHGRYGEDGVVQGFLAVVGIPCVGSGVAASALAMDKVWTREVVAARGIAIVKGTEIRITEPEAERRRRVGSLGLPAVVKDPTGGSSLDVTIARSAPERDAAVAALLARPAGRVLVEAYVPGREITCPVLGNASRCGPLRALPPVLIRPRRSSWFDYETKYDPEAVDEICPAPVEEEILARVRTGSLVVHAALGCDGLTRSDFMVPEDGVPRFLEINTLPGLTPASISPKSAAVAGLPFPDLLRELVESCLS